ncbi:MAG: KEOPS complex subunit Cgi121 [Candidatus Poseidoniia archaeon]|nr:KEOPS complex subunit Cgi121 [Candidatus Poseidoniia archaeon]
MELTVGCGHLKINNLDSILSFVSPNLAIIESKSICGIEHLRQAASLSLSSHKNGFNLSKDKSTEVLLFLTAQRQISKALKLAGVNKKTKSVGWVLYGDDSSNLSEIIKEDISVLSISNYDFSNLASDIDINFDDKLKQKIIMTRTATLPVQPR